MVVLDSGDVFHMNNQALESEMESVKARAELFVKAFNKEGMAALGIGERDLGVLGVKGLLELQKHAKFPIVCANLVDKDGKDVFKSFAVVEVAGFKLGVTGVISPGAEPKEKDEYKLLAPAEGLKKALDALSKESVDAVILLAHLDQQDALMLVREVPGVDLVLGGQSMGQSRFIEKLESAWWLESGQRGKFISVVSLSMTSPGRKAFVVREEADKLRAELKQIDERVKRYAELAGRPGREGTRTAEPARFKGVIESMLRQREDIVAKAKNIVQAPGDSPFLGYESVPLDRNQREDEETAGWVAEFEKKYVAGGGHGGVSRTTSGGAVPTSPPSRRIPHKALKTLHDAPKVKAGATPSK
ncbi:MAG: hypothetical protein FJ109_15640 [Deltaproteobacteria bacterium]|nr:hypothetical protein [Deltaproteobacteria bacterium]